MNLYFLYIHMVADPPPFLITFCFEQLFVIAASVDWLNPACRRRGVNLIKGNPQRSCFKANLYSSRQNSQNNPNVNHTSKSHTSTRFFFPFLNSIINPGNIIKAIFIVLYYNEIFGSHTKKNNLSSLHNY